jgi:hypothetical protein
MLKPFMHKGVHYASIQVHQQDQARIIRQTETLGRGRQFGVCLLVFFVLSFVITQAHVGDCKVGPG